MKNNPNVIKKKIIEYSKNIGIDALGFVKAEPFFREIKRLNYAEKKGYLSNFICKDNHENLLKNYKTIISVLIKYPNPILDAPKKPSNNPKKQVLGRISASSWGLDYHKVLTDLLEDICKYIKTISNLKKFHISVDQTPLSEREIAAKAGLGWIGKNSNLINQDLGSFVFIGEIFLDVELPGEEKNIIKDLCGDCNLCVEACPVKAIDGEYRVINTKLCLSQQSQEKETSNNLVIEKIKETKYVFGCDICQEVCPWNKKERIFNPLFNPIMDEVYIDLRNLSLESNKTFKIKYGHLSGSWRGKKPWQKNADIILSDFDF